ncbi:MAG: hypothetical protein LBH74_05510 [Nitrososphaerota archaeon]|jgi:hypothetical protein|nr:hypothetical protein [Nitrososphaerota archaeon]
MSQTELNQEQVATIQQLLNGYLQTCNNIRKNLMLGATSCLAAEAAPSEIHILTEVSSHDQ